VAMADSHDQQRPNSLGGDALCLVSGAFYACYTVAIKRMLGRDEDANTVPTPISPCVFCGGSGTVCGGGGGMCILGCRLRVGVGA